MKTGLLWLDDDPRTTLEDKVLKAAAHYERKYGQSPNMCFVHPSTFDGNGKHPVKKVGRVEIRAGRSVLQDHFWLGVADEEGQGKSRPQCDLVVRVQGAGRPMTPERARQLAMELENVLE